MPARILVYGVTGAGKTTFARRLSEQAGIPWHAADELAFEPGWVGVPDEIQRERVAAICARDEWILDTAYAKWIDIPLNRAQLIIGLDYPRWFSLVRLARRSLARMIDKEPVCNGNVETLRNLLSRDSIMLWHFRSFARKRARMRHWAEAQEVPTLLFKREADANAWLAHVAREE